MIKPRCELLTAVTFCVFSGVFWSVTPCSLVDVSEERSGYSFYPEYGCMFHRNVPKYIPDYKVSS